MDHARADTTPGPDLHVEVLVAGAGLAGLAAAVTAAGGGRRVAVLDVRSPGGRASSATREGFVLNQGPHALYVKGAGAAVLGALGVRVEGAAPHRVAAGARAGRLGLLPTSAGSLARSGLVGWRGKAALARLLARFPRIDAAALGATSTAAWVRSLGLPEDAAAVLRTLLRVASYAPDLEAVSADGPVRQLQLVQGGGVRYLHGGWTRIVEGLLAAAAGAGVRVVPGQRVQRVAAGPGGGWDVVTDAGTWRSAAVVVAAGGPAAARALLPADPGWRLGEDATAACLDLGLRRIPPTPLAFDLDAPLYLSTHAPSAALAPPGAALVHVMRYGARSSDEDRAQLWRFASLAGIAPGDVVVERFLHRMVVSHALPVPGHGLAGRPSHAVPGRPGLFVAGDWVGPVGLLADAALASGRAAGAAAASAPAVPAAAADVAAGALSR